MDKKPMEVIKLDTNANVTEVINHSLEGLQEAIGGYVEAVYLRHNVFNHKGKKYTIMLVDEEGLLKNKPINNVATLVYRGNTLPNKAIIVGDVVFTTEKIWN